MMRPSRAGRPAPPCCWLNRSATNPLCNSLDVLAAACRADRDLDAAWQAATRYLEAAARIGGHHRPYYAARTALMWRWTGPT